MIRGFTLVETCVVMIIGMLVAGAAFWSYRALGGQLEFYRKMSRQVLDESKSDFMIRNDLFHSAFAMEQNRWIRLVNRDSSVISYFFADTIVIRSSDQRNDTLHRDVLEVELRKAGVSGLVEEIYLRPGEGAIGLFTREYGADMLMKTFENHGWNKD